VPTNLLESHKAMIIWTRISASNMQVLGVKSRQNIVGRVTYCGKPLLNVREASVR
jgi:hypothetical protein